MHLPSILACPPPRMQKFTCEELCRMGLVCSPGLSTESETAVPGANPLPTPVAGLTISATRLPFSGARKAARRSISASSFSLGTTTGGMSFTGSAEAPVRSMNRSEEHTSELQSHLKIVCPLLLVKKNIDTELQRRSAA